MPGHPNIKGTMVMEVLNGARKNAYWFELSRWAVDILQDKIIPSLDTKELSVILLNYAKLVKLPVDKEHQPVEDLQKRLLQSWQDDAISKIAQFSPQGLSNSLYAFALLGVQPSDEFLHAWTNQAIATLHETEPDKQFKPQELSNSLYAFARLGIQPSDEFIAAWEQAVIRKICDFNPQDLSNSLYAFAQLGIQPSEAFLHAWEEDAISKIHDFTPQALSNSIYGLAVLSSISGNKIILPTEFIGTVKDNGNGFPEEAMHQLYLADRWFRPSSTPRASIFDLDYADALELAKEQVDRVSHMERRLVKQLENSPAIVELIQDKGIKMDPNGFVPCIGSRADICFSHKSGEDRPPRLLCMMQADGSFHYVRTPDGSRTLNGSTQLQNAILDKYNTPYIRVNLMEDINIEALAGEIANKINDKLAQSSARSSGGAAKG